MFSFADAFTDDDAVSSVPSESLNDTARHALRLSRQSEARAILLAHRIGEECYHQVLTELSVPEQMSVRNRAEKVSVGEVSLQLGISRTKAGMWIRLGEALGEHRRIRQAFLAGDFSSNRAQIMVRAAQQVPSALLEDTPTTPGIGPVDITELMVDLATRASNDNVLRDQLDELVISFDPDAAADARDDVAAYNQDVRIRPDAHGHSTVDACMPAEQGVHLGERIASLIAERLCCNDPRNLGEQRVAALGEIQGYSSGLACMCGGTCAEDIRKSRVTGAVVHLDPTGSTPPRLSGYGAIDPHHAEAIIDDPETTTVVLPERPAGLVRRSPGHRVTDRDPGPPIDPNGHGGLDLPPPGALTYRPAASMRQEIIAADRRCRYPHCARPAEDCDIDHVIPFDHTNPVDGGWSVPDNLIPLCRPDHQRKHLGPWRPTVHRNRVVVWRNIFSGETVATYPG